MRAAVLSIFALAALCGGVSAFPSSSSALKAKSPARELQVQCQTAVYALTTCSNTYGAGGNKDAVIANCCAEISALNTACGSSVFERVSKILDIAAFNLPSAKVAMDYIDVAACTGKSEEVCANAVIAATNACTTPENPDCCQALTNQIEACVGTTAARDDAFWDSLQALVSPSCAPFPVITCNGASNALHNCASLPGYAAAGLCCKQLEWHSMFCMNHVKSAADDWVNPDLVAAADIGCSSNNNGGSNPGPGSNNGGSFPGPGSNNGGSFPGPGSNNGGSFPGPGSNSGYPPVNCNWDRVAYSFAKYTDASGYTQLVTNNPSFAVGYYHDPNNWQNTVYPTPWFTDSRGHSYYPIDWSKVPSELNYKLQPRNPLCYATTYPPSRR